MQMRSPGLKPSAVTIHARRLSASITADRSPRKKNVPFGLLGCGNFRTSSKGTVARVLLRYRLRNVTSDSTCCRRRRRGMSPAGLSCAPWLLFQSPDGVHPTEQSRRLRVTRAQTHTRLSLTHTNIHTYRHTSTHELTVSLDGACQVRSRTPPPFPPPLPPPPSRAVCSSTHAPLDGSIHNDLCKPTLRQ